MTPTPNGIHYYQTTPERINFIAGLADLRVFKWKEGRLLRWYAPCCGSPMFNTLDSPKWAFASINTERFGNPDALGPAIAYAFKPMPNGKPKTKGFGRFMAGFAHRTIWARVSGAWRNTPFFETTGETISPIKQLTQKDRENVRLTEPV